MYHCNNIACNIVILDTGNQIAPQAVQPTCMPPTQHALQLYECKFFHHIPNDDNFYLVNCKMILQGSVSLDNHGYDHGFFYHYSNNSAANYYITCKLVSHYSIVNILNKEIYGMDVDINHLNQKVTLSLNQKFNLEQNLKQILPFYFTQMTSSNGNMNSFYEHNIMATQAANSQNNFDNVGRTHSQQQIGVNNFPPHHIPKREMRPDDNRNIDSFHGNIATQSASTTNINQNYNDNSLTVNNYIAHQDARLQPQHYMTEREAISDNRSLYENIQNGLISTQAISLTNINRKYNNNGLPCNIAHQSVNRVGDYTHTTCSQQPTNFPPRHIQRETSNSFHGNIENSVVIAQANQNYGDNILPCNEHISCQDIIGTSGYTYNITTQANLLQHHVMEREIRPEYNRNTNSFHEDIGNNPQAVSVTTNINQNYNDHALIGGYTHPQQQ